MYQIKLASSTRKALKKLGRSGKFNQTIFNKVVRCLQNGDPLPFFVKDHQLQGNFIGSRECHLEFNLLLIYERDDVERIVTISDIGTHQELFGE